jgi:hypothetical protein
MNERPIPVAALRDKSSVEMLRVWIAERKLHCSIECVRKIRQSYLKELDAPTSDAQGAFVNWKKA